jgi:tripartite-type tricarboxylate transporter receptor subunit TctC
MPGTWHSNGPVNMYVDRGTTRKTDTVVTGSDRVPVLPTTATLAEAGFPGVPGTAWIGLAAPAGTRGNCQTLE